MCFLHVVSYLLTQDLLQTYDLTIEDAFRKEFAVDNKICRLDVIDTAGQGKCYRIHRRLLHLTSLSCVTRGICGCT
jgi:GTPase SAR1 family protein